MCRTSIPRCCREVKLGQWYFPNGSLLLTNGDGHDLYRNRDDTGNVRLNRRNNVMGPHGLYTCEIPNTGNVLVNLTITLHTANGKNGALHHTPLIGREGGGGGEFKQDLNCMYNHMHSPFYATTCIFHSTQPHAFSTLRNHMHSPFYATTCILHSTQPHAFSTLCNHMDFPFYATTCTPQPHAFSTLCNHMDFPFYATTCILHSTQPHPFSILRNHIHFPFYATTCILHSTQPHAFSTLHYTTTTLHCTTTCILHSTQLHLYATTCVPPLDYTPQ